MTQVPYYYGQGLNGNCSFLTNRECWYWYNAIEAAIYEWNLVLISDLDGPFQLVSGGTLPDGTPPAFGIVFTLGDLQLGTYPDCTAGIGSSGEISMCGGAVPPGQNWGLTMYNFSVPSSGDLAFLEVACVHFADPQDVHWVDGAPDGVDRKTVALHEIGHALGLGHGNGDGCLMEEGIYGGCGDVMGIDGVTIEAASCLYGSLFGPCNPRWSILPYTNSQGNPEFLFGYCDCSGACGTPKEAKLPYSYELALSEAGGPYETFATLGDGDLTDNTYEHAFSQSYASARIRLRVLDGASVVDEAYSAYAMAIQASVTATAPLTRDALGVRNSPNPTGATTTISFDLPGRSFVEVDIYDASGRHVVTLHRGEMSAGPQRLIWNGRLADGTRVASGVYPYVVRTAEREATGRIVWLR